MSQETYLPAIGAAWTSHDLTSAYGVPAPNQAPSPLLHDDAAGGLTWTSVFSTDASNLHYRETYLPGVGSAWTTKDMTTLYGTPAV